MQQLTEIFTKVGRIQFMILGLIASGFVFFGKYFITEIYVSAEYENAYYAALFLVLPLIVPLIQNVGIEIQRAVNKHKFRSFIYLGMALINVVISIPLGIFFGCIGVAAGTGISIVVANGIIMNIYYHKSVGVDIVSFWKSIAGIAKALIIPVVFGLVIIKFVDFGGVFEFCLWVLVYAVIYCVSVFMFGTVREEKEWLLNSIKKRSRL